MENKKFFTYTLIAACLICLVAVYFRVFTDMELPGRIMAAILGVVITASITQLLLEGQTEKELRLREEQANKQRESDEKQKEWQEEQARKAEEWRLKHDRSNTVFGEKIKIYQKFLDVLYNAVKDGELTEFEKLELQYQTSLVAMHCEPDNIQKLSEAVKQVISVVCEPNKQRSPNDNTLLKTLFEVVEALRKDLYDKDFKPFPAGVKEQTISNFNTAYNKAKDGVGEDKIDEKRYLSVDLKALPDINLVLKSDQIGLLTETDKIKAVGEYKVYDTSIWDNAVKDWQDKGWIVRSMESEDCPLQITRKDGNLGMIDMGFYDNHYFIQARYEGDWNFSKCLKWDNGGRRQREMWWEYPTLSMDVPKGGFIDKFKSSPELQQQIIKRVEYLQDIILKTHRTHLWMQEVGEPKNWNLFTWYWTTLACESQSEEKGKIYMDTLPVDGKDAVAIQLGNRANSIEQLKDILTHMGLSDRLGEIQEDGCFITLEEVASLRPEDVGKRLRHWACLISQKVLNEK